MVAFAWPITPHFGGVFGGQARLIDVRCRVDRLQATEFERGDFHKLIAVINGCQDDNQLSQKVLDTVFDKWWPDFEDGIRTIWMQPQRQMNRSGLIGILMCHSEVAVIREASHHQASVLSLKKLPQ